MKTNLISKTRIYSPSKKLYQCLAFQQALLTLGSEREKFHFIEWEGGYCLNIMR